MDRDRIYSGVPGLLGTAGNWKIEQMKSAKRKSQEDGSSAVDRTHFIDNRCFLPHRSTPQSKPRKLQGSIH